MQKARSVHSRWFGPLPVCVAWFALIVAFVHPPYGTGASICWMRAMTDLPCPGWLKHARRIATRYEETALKFLAMLKLAMIQRYFRIDLRDTI